jgi:hypothetical protein
MSAVEMSETVRGVYQRLHPPDLSEGALTCVDDAAEAFRRKSQMPSLMDWRAQRNEFRSKPHKVAVIYGGGPATTLSLQQFTKDAAFADTHFILVHDGYYPGALGVDAISPYIRGHRSTRTTQLSSGMKMWRHPHVDVIPGMHVSPEEAASFAVNIGAQMVIDARGGEPTRSPFAGLPRTFSTPGFLDLVNKPFNAEGVFTDEALMRLHDRNGKLGKTIISGGGNATRDLQVATQVIATIDEASRMYGVPPESFDPEKIADYEGGILAARRALGLPTTHDIHFVGLYHGRLENLKMTKLMRQGQFPGDLGQQMKAQALAWQQQDGGRFDEWSTATDAVELPSGQMKLTISDERDQSGKTIRFDTAGNHVDALGYAALEPLPVSAPQIRRGMAAGGSADLGVTGKAIISGMPQAREIISAIQPPAMTSYRKSLERVFMYQRANGVLAADGQLGDPVDYVFRNAPRAMVAKAWRTKESAPSEA